MISQLSLKRGYCALDCVRTSSDRLADQSSITDRSCLDFFQPREAGSALGCEASTMFALEATTRVMLDVAVLVVNSLGSPNLGTANANICHFREHSTLSYQIDAKISHADALALEDCRSKPVPRCQAHLHSRWLTRPPRCFSCLPENFAPRRHHHYCY
jgi:hypothetical protein